MAFASAFPTGKEAEPVSPTLPTTEAPETGLPSWLDVKGSPKSGYRYPFLSRTDAPLQETVTKVSKSSGVTESESESGDTYNYEYNYEYNYYYFDVGLQFTPRVGSIFSINTSPYITYVGSAALAQPNTPFAQGAGTAWQPDKEDLPNIAGSLGLTYRYAALYDGYWGTKQYMFDSNDSAFWGKNHPGIPSKPIESSPDDATTTFERSWQNRNPGMVTNEKEEKEDFFEGSDIGSHPETDSPRYEAPSWFGANKLKGNMKDVADGLENAFGEKGGTMPIPDSLVSAQEFYEWYRDTDVAKQDKDTFNAKSLAIPDKVRDKLSDDVLRAIDILGEDILLRDEWVASDGYMHNIWYTTYPAGDESWAEPTNFYYYIYSNTSIFDNWINGKKGATSALTSGNDSLLTQDYVIQSIYRTLGLNCAKSSVYLYADKHYTINNTPLATQLTVALDKVNQIQNRMDVFVTRANLDKYWEKAVADGIVKNSGVTTVNYIDGEYKPFTITSESANVPEGVTHIEDKQIDVERMKHITLAEFCVLLKRLMHIYGEEVLTEKEQDMLLVYNGTKLPYYLTDTEQFEAIKYLMAKGIVDDQMLWTGDLRVEDMLIILSRVKDKGSRLTYKELDLVYDESLLDMGYYPASITTGIDKPTVEVLGAVNDHEIAVNGDTWVDYYIQVDDSELFKRNGEKMPYNEIMLESTVLNNMSDLTPVKGFEVVGYEKLKDNKNYLHFKVQCKLMFKTDDANNILNPIQKNDLYVSSDDEMGWYLSLNTTSAYDNPEYYDVSIGGGIYNTKVLKNDEKRNLPFYRFPSRYYMNGNDIRVNTMTATELNLSEYKIPLYNEQELLQFNCYTSTVTSVTEDGYVEKAVALEYTNRPSEGNNIQFHTFNDKNFGIDKLDLERIYAGYAMKLLADPYLSDKKANSIFNIVPTYSIYFTVAQSEESLKGEKDYALVGDIKWGADVVVESTSPTVIKPAGEDLGLIFHTQVPGHATYCIKGAKTLDEVGHNLHICDDEGNPITSVKAIPAYTKQNKTFLIDSNTLEEVMVEYNLYKKFRIQHVNITEYSDDLILISYEVNNDRFTLGDTIVNNIFLMNSLKLIAVNNYIYKIPDDEVLYVKKQDGGYLFNFRVALGWPSGFSYDKSTVRDDGGIELNLSANDDISDNIQQLHFEQLEVSNVFTQDKESVIGVKKTITRYVQGLNHDVTEASFMGIPLSSAYPLANYFVYEHPTLGTHIFILKNYKEGMIVPTDQYMVQGALSGKTILSDKGKVGSTYKLGTELLDSMLGVKFTQGESGLDGNYIVAAHPLDSTTSADIVIEYDDVLKATKDTVANLGGKLYYDPTISTWVYIIPTRELPKTERAAYATGFSSTEGSKYLTDLKSIQEYSAGLIDDYYNCTMSLPFFVTSTADTYTVYNIASNIYKADDQYYYGVTPGYTVNWYTGNNKSEPFLPQKDDPSKETGLSYDKYDLVTMNGFVAKDVTGDTLVPIEVPAPIAVTPAVLGVPSLSVKDLGGINDNNTVKGDGEHLQYQYVYDGNIRYVVQKDSRSEGSDALKDTANKDILIHGAYLSLPSELNVKQKSENWNKRIRYFIDGSDTCTLIALSTGKAMLSRSVYKDVITSTRKDIEDVTKQASLNDLSQPTNIDWDEFTFSRLIHDIDNGFSILLILVLNFLPRVAMFVFIILIGLSTIANMHIWRQFCQNVFDPYKLITFGHSDVLTINTKTLLISSIIGLAVFALFMDGTIIHLLTWIVQLFSGIAVR